MSFDWQSLVASVAPVLGTALGGPMGGVAARTALAALGIEASGSDDKNKDKLGQAMQGATTEQLLALKKADNDFSRDMKQLDVDFEKVAAADRDSARKREIATKDPAPKLLAFVIVAGFFSILYTIAFVEMPESAQQPINLLLGALTAMLTQVGNYYFGSSAGSARKNEIIAGQQHAR